MKKIILTFTMILVLTCSFGQVDSPHYSFANNQLLELMKYFESVSDPLSETQQKSILEVNMGILGKIEGIKKTDMPEEIKQSSIADLKIVREKYISKNLTDSQREKYKSFVLPEKNK
jgi:hypothetical protein